MNPYTVAPHVYYVSIGSIAIIQYWHLLMFFTLYLNTGWIFPFSLVHFSDVTCDSALRGIREQTTDNFGPSLQTCQSPSKLWFRTVPFHKIWIYNPVCFHHFVRAVLCLVCLCSSTVWPHTCSLNDSAPCLWFKRRLQICVLSNLLKKRETLSHADFHVIMETCHTRGVCEDNNYHNTHVVK